MAVIISIIYLGLQIRNTRIQNKKEMHLDMSKFRSEMTLKLASDKELSYLVAQGLSGQFKMAPNDYFRFSNFAISYFIAYEVAFQRNKSKDLDIDIANGLNDSPNWRLSFPGVRLIWKNNMDYGFSKQFKDHINGLISSEIIDDDNRIQSLIEFMKKAGERMSPKEKTKKD